jgi:thiamine-monophosphate kinase
MTAPESISTLGEIGEEALVARLVACLQTGERVMVGPGDDCAVVNEGGRNWSLLKTDCIVEGVHFLPGTEPKLVGRKAINRVLSDIAAMGGWPGYALVTIATDGGRSVAEVDGWYEGLSAAAAAACCTIVGGETTRLPFPGALLSVSMVGEVHPERCITRSGAVSGEGIFVTGRLGGSFSSGRHLTFNPRLAEAAWLVENHPPSAMMDLSDGLGSDLPRLARASGVGFAVELGDLPCHDGITPEQACGEGEDYELLFTYSLERASKLQRDWLNHHPDVPLTQVGRITPSGCSSLPRGWEHYLAS